MSLLSLTLACANLVASFGRDDGWSLVSLAMGVLGLVVGGYWWQRSWALRLPPLGS